MEINYTAELYKTRRYLSYLYPINESNLNYNSNGLEKKLGQLWDSKNTLTLGTKNKKYAILSDFHLGDGSSVDKFKYNEDVALRALEYYYINNYTLILLGDIEELWRFRLEEILRRYRDTIYKAFRRFGNSRIYRIYGNHDIDWKNLDPVRSYENPSLMAQEAIKLKDVNNDASILLIHGHQGTNDADQYSWISRPIIKGYRYFEPLVSMLEYPSAPRSPIFKSFELARYNWAKRKKIILICGHTHRAVFCSISKIDQLNAEISDLELQLDATVTESERN